MASRSVLDDLGSMLTSGALGNLTGLDVTSAIGLLADLHDELDDIPLSWWQARTGTRSLHFVSDCGVLAAPDTRRTDDTFGGALRAVEAGHAWCPACVSRVSLAGGHSVANLAKNLVALRTDSPIPDANRLRRLAWNRHAGLALGALVDDIDGALARFRGRFSDDDLLVFAGAHRTGADLTRLPHARSVVQMLRHALLVDDMEALAHCFGIGDVHVDDHASWDLTRNQVLDDAHHAVDRITAGGRDLDQDVWAGYRPQRQPDSHVAREPPTTPTCWRCSPATRCRSGRTVWSCGCPDG